MANEHRINFKLPNGIEFNAEGVREDVRADYAAFLEYLKSSVAPVTPAKQEPKPPAGNPAEPPKEGEPDEALLKRVFDLSTDGLISLKVLPRGDTAQADGLLLLLYGYLRIAQQENVFAVTLSRAATKSGIQFERIDRAIEPHSAYVRRGGLKRGATYTLNNQGIAHAAKIAMTLLE